MARKKAKGRKRPGLLYRQAQLRGLLGGSRPWMILWSVLAARRVLKRLTADTPEVLDTITIAPGQAIVISNRDREPNVITPQ
jgi:hypothetical protein